MKPPTGRTPVSEWSLRSRKGRRLLSKRDGDSRASDTEHLGEEPTDPHTSARHFGRARGFGVQWAHVWEGAAPVKKTRAKRGLAAPLALSFAVLFAAGCGESGAPRGPVASLARSTDAEAAFRPLLTRWHELPRADRATLEPELRRFRERYGADPLARLADAMRASLALDAGDLDTAEALAHAVTAGPAGSTRDLALVVRGGVARRRGEPERALEALLPLSHKLIDEDARELHSEEVVLAAMDAGRYDLALTLAAAWLRESAGPERTVARVAVLVASMPPEALAAHLEVTTARGLPAETSLLAVVARLLAEVAQEQNDATLARLLVERVGPLLGSSGDAVAKLASGARKGRITGPTVGLLLHLDTPEARRRSAEISAGMAHALGLPGSGARLVTRDDGGATGAIPEALAALGAEGAGIVVGGTDGASAEALARAGELAALPVVLLAAPATLDPANAAFSFLLGESEEHVPRLLGEALGAAGADPVRIVLAPCDLDGLPSLGPHEGLVIAGPAACATEAIARRLVSPGRLGLGLDTAAVRIPVGAFQASAGLLPAPRGAAALEASYAAWVLGHHRPPTYWEALGHDAAKLAWAGVRELTARSTEDPNEVAALRRAAREGLASAEGALWSTEVRGFAGARVLPRTVTISVAR